MIRHADRADEYRAKEVECKEHAERAFDLATKRTLEELARNWHQMAERAERNTR